jgi:putative transposase
MAAVSCTTTRDTTRPSGKKLVTPMAKRTAMGILRDRHGFSQRRACRLVGLHRSTADYTPIHKDEAELR